MHQKQKQMTEVNHVSNPLQRQILGFFVFLLILSNTLVENSNKSYQEFNMIIVLHVYHKRFGITLPDNLSHHMRYLMQSKV